VAVAHDAPEFRHGKRTTGGEGLVDDLEDVTLD